MAAVSCSSALQANCQPRVPAFCAARRAPRRLTAAVRATAVEGTTTTETISLTLRKPMGIVLAERKGPPPSVFIEELVEGGNAAKDGRLQVGDTLVKCSAVLLKAGTSGEAAGHGDRPYDNFERVFFDARGKQFDTVMAALGSNSDRWGYFDVALEFERPAADGQAAAAAEAGSS